jgi:hypothetical protein
LKKKRKKNCKTVQLLPAPQNRLTNGQLHHRKRARKHGTRLNANTQTFHVFDTPLPTRKTKKPNSNKLMLSAKKNKKNPFYK